MRRRAVALLTALLILGGMAPTHAASAFSIARRERFCRYESWNGRAGVQWGEGHLMLRCATRKWAVRIGGTDAAPIYASTADGYRIARYIVDRESGFYCKAANPSSSAAGALQIVAGTWASWWSTFSPDMDRWHLANDRLNCRPNIMVGVRAMHRYGLGAWGG